jgi:tRNA 2-selenouridine synthase SelU
MNNVTATLKAWLPEYSSLKPEELHTEKAVNEMVFSLCDMRGSGWTYVGDATINVDLVLTPDQLIASKIETLKAQQTKVRAEAYDRVNQLEAMIQNLLAISYVAEAS